jgi:mannose-6-phosphate isomerase-like protein (cupin superfamily)
MKTERSDLELGNVILISGGQNHQLKNTGREPLIFVCVIPSVALELWLSVFPAAF